MNPETQENSDGASEPLRPRGAALRKLLARAQRLKARLSVGREGLSEAFLAEVDHELAGQGLLKIRLDVEDRHTAEEMAHDLAGVSRACLLRRIGRVAILYRPKKQPACEDA